MKILNTAILKLLFYLIAGIITGFYFPGVLSGRTAYSLLLFLLCLLGLALSYNRRILFEGLTFALFFTLSCYHTGIATREPLLPENGNQTFFIDADFILLGNLGPTAYYDRYLVSGKLLHTDQREQRFILRSEDIVSKRGKVRGKNE